MVKDCFSVFIVLYLPPVRWRQWLEKWPRSCGLRPPWRVIAEQSYWGLIFGGKFSTIADLILGNTVTFRWRVPHHAYNRTSSSCLLTTRTALSKDFSQSAGTKTKSSCRNCQKVNEGFCRWLTVIMHVQLRRNIAPSAACTISYVTVAHYDAQSL